MCTEGSLEPGWSPLALLFVTCSLTLSITLPSFSFSLVHNIPFLQSLPYLSTTTPFSYRLSQSTCTLPYSLFHPLSANFSLILFLTRPQQSPLLFSLSLKHSPPSHTLTPLHNISPSSLTFSTYLYSFFWICVSPFPSLYFLVYFVVFDFLPSLTVTDFSFLSCISFSSSYFSFPRFSVYNFPSLFICINISLWHSVHFLYPFFNVYSSYFSFPNFSFVLSADATILSYYDLL